MDELNGNRLAIALLLLILAWVAALWWFNPLGWATAVLLSLLALAISPPPP